MRFDFVFSYWLLVWFLVYLILGGPSPKWWIGVALAYEGLTLVTYYVYRYPTKLVLFFICMTVKMKLIPLWVMRNDKIKTRDIGAGAILFAVYVGWLALNKTSPLKVYKKSLQEIKDGVPSSPMAKLVFKSDERLKIRGV